jgi:BlaI family transcriptional regulator, penicillinase repressor
MKRFAHLSRRERQIMDVLYKAGRGTAADVQAGMPDPPGYSAVRAMLRILEEKGHIRHEQEGTRYVFIPMVKRDRAKRSALQHVVDTFFEGSASQVMAALLDTSAKELDDEELTRLRQLIDSAAKGKK